MFILVCLLFNLVNNTFTIPAKETNPSKEVHEKNQTEDALLKEIRELEKQKGDLYKEIDKAIEESIVALNKSNDRDANVGVNYIKDLKNQMKELNDTDDVADVIYSKDRGNLTFFNTTTNNGLLQVIASGFSVNTRRKLKANMKKKSSGQGDLRQMPTLADDDDILIDAEKELNQILYKDLSAIQLKERLATREKVRARLEEWIKMKDLEKAKIKAYHDRQKTKVKFVEELCPRTGYSNASKKTERGNHGCCRKCCKKSIMGCLKK